MRRIWVALLQMVAGWLKRHRWMYLMPSQRSRSHVMMFSLSFALRRQPLINARLITLTPLQQPWITRDLGVIRPPPLWVLQPNAKRVADGVTFPVVTGKRCGLCANNGAPVQRH